FPSVLLYLFSSFFYYSPDARLYTLSYTTLFRSEAPKELMRFRHDVFEQNPDLVIWQVGTNAVWQPADQKPPSFDETTQAIRDGKIGRAHVLTPVTWPSRMPSSA